MSTLLNRLGVELPIVQAPMAGCQGAALAIAVAEAGGLGSLPCALLIGGAMRRELDAIRAATSRPVNVNFFCHQTPEADPGREAAWRRALRPYYDEWGIDPEPGPAGPPRLAFDGAALDVLRDVRPPVVSFHFGLPAAPLLADVKALGATVMASATTVDEARWLEAHGVDVIIAQGLEAGGHRGMFLTTDVTTQVGTMALVAQVVDAVRVPVVAAGGIADARGVAAALALGAAAVQVGTAYLLCPEATTSPVHRAALADAARGHTSLTNVFTGRPARAIVNRLMRELGPMREDAPAFPLAAAAVTPLRATAEAAGSRDFSPLWAGQNATGCRKMPAGALTRQLAGLP